MAASADIRAETSNHGDPVDSNGHHVVIKHDMKFTEEEVREEAP